MNCNTKASGIWVGLQRVESEYGDVEHRWTEEATRSWNEQILPRLGIGPLDFERIVAVGGHVLSSYSIYIFFPADMPVSGHVFYHRKHLDNLITFNYRHWRGKVPLTSIKQYVGTGFIAVRSKCVLRKLAEESPMFVPMWEELKDVSPDERGFYLADAPEAKWLESIQPNEQRLYDAFRDGFGPGIVGMGSVAGSEEARKCLREFERTQQCQAPAEVDAAFITLAVAAPKYWEFWESYALYYLDQDNADRACNIVEEAQKRYPDCLMLDRLGAFCCFRRGDWDGVEKHAVRYREMNPWDSFATYALVTAAFEKKDYPLVAQLYRDCMDEPQASVTAMINCGVALFNLHRYEEALGLFMREKTRRPDSPQVLNNIGMALASMGRLDETVEYCQQALALDPAYRFAWDTLGFAHLKAGRYEEAIPALLKAIELEPNYPDAWRHLLHAYDRSGQAEKLAGAKTLVAGILPAEVARFEQEKGMDIKE